MTALTHPNSEPDDSKRCDNTIQSCPPENGIKRENIIFVGAEQYYDSFWLKMMFIGAAYVIASRGKVFRAADKKTIAYVPTGYTRHERLAIEYLKNKAGFNIVKLADSDSIIDYINNRPEIEKSGIRYRFLLQDIAFFSHGLPDAIMLNFWSDPDIDFGKPEVDRCQAASFAPGGRIYSYACRTGVASSASTFKNDADARPEDNLAQYMANHFRVEVHAFLRRTFYGSVLRSAADSDAISTFLRQARATLDGQVIDIPPDHQALPHPGLADGFFSGARKEGTNAYALWRKAGGIDLPTAADTPKGLSGEMHVFTAK